MFDRFWRAEEGAAKGTGLGLYIAKGIVDAHHGHIWVESRVGTGSAFIFELPIDQNQSRVGSEVLADVAEGDARTE